MPHIQLIWISALRDNSKNSGRLSQEFIKLSNDMSTMIGPDLSLIIIWPTKKKATLVTRQEKNEDVDINNKGTLPYR